MARFQAAVRCHNGSRVSWALLSLLIRLAQAVNLHRDGDGSAFSPFVAEMRRRLWWALVVLDVRAVEDRGTESLITSESFNTRLPTNIDDADLGPDSTAAQLSDRDGPTDITFNLCTAMCSAFHLDIDELLRRGRGQAEEEIIAHVQRLEARFIDGADLAHVPSAMAARTVRLIILKLWLGMQYPVRVLPARAGSTAAHAASVAGRPPVSHEDMLRTAVSIMELAKWLNTASEGERYDWWFSTYVQWHPLAVALAELCTQTEGELVDRAWRVIDDVFERWSHLIADNNRGRLWRPIRKLFKKAKAARAQALKGTLSIDPTEEASRSLEELGGLAKETRSDFGLQANELLTQPATDSAPWNIDCSGISPPDVFQGYSELFNVDSGQELGISQDFMDWTNWNEFVSDAYADAEPPLSCLW